MNVAPVINCFDEACLHERWKRAGEIGAHEAHFDISDGVFSPAVTACTPKLLRELLKQNPLLKAEVHLMVQNPESVIDAWLLAGAKKVIVHIEAIHDLQFLKDRVLANGAELVLGIKMDTNVKKLSSCLENRLVSAVHLLEVPIGFSGGDMNPNAVDRIKFVRDIAPQAVISVDGGITEETAQKVAAAGANRIVSSSFIWNSTSSKNAYELLLKTGS